MMNEFLEIQLKILLPVNVGLDTINFQAYPKLTCQSLIRLKILFLFKGDTCIET